MIDRLIRELEQGQNPDGGWGYNRGASWTEPTCFALLALRACDGSASAQIRSRQWLFAHQAQDGGWSPQPSIPISTWVTSLVLIALDSGAPMGNAEVRALQWLKAQVGIQRMGLDWVRHCLFGAPTNAAYPEGWSFLPGTASWVMPTALAIVALAKSRDVPKDSAIAARVSDGRRFLLSRRCSDGGWNHGGSFVRGEGAGSYPETTGVALLAFQGGRTADLEPSLMLAENWLARADSVEARSWIRIALSAHGRTPTQPDTPNTRCWTNYDRSLCLLAEASRCGRNEFAAALA